MKKLIPVAVIFVVAAAFFGGFIFSNKAIFGTDFLDIGYFTVKFLHDFFGEYGRYPLWDPHLHGGIPFIEGMHGVIFFPLALPLRLLMETHRAWGWGYFIYMLCAGLSMFLLLKQYRLKIEAALFGGLAYMLSPVLMSFIYAGHDGRMSVIALMPFIIWLLERALEKQKFFDFLLFGLGYAFYVLTVHLQMVFYASWLIGALFVFRVVYGVISKGITAQIGAKISAMFVAALALGCFSVMFQIYPPYDYLGKYSSRTVRTDADNLKFAGSWRMNAEDFASAAFPDFVGINLGEKNTYWGRNVFRLNSFYLGLLCVVLALAATITLRKPILFFLSGFSLFTITYGLGTQTPLFLLYYHVIPAVKKFRAPEMLFFTVMFAVCVGAAYAIDYIINYTPSDSKKDKKAPQGARFFKTLLWTAIAFSGILLVLSVLGKPMMHSWLSSVENYAGANIAAKQNAIDTNFPYFLKSSYLALLLMWIGLGVAFWRARTTKLAPAAVTAILCLVLIIDLWRVSKPFVVLTDIQKHFPQTDLVTQLKTEYKNQPFRTFSISPQVSYTYLGTFGLDALTFSELHGNQLRWYDEFTGKNEQPQNIQRYPHFWDILNVKYVVSPQALNIPILAPVAQTQAGLLYKNQNGFPRARSFHRWENIEHAAALDRLKNTAFATDTAVNYQNTLLVEGGKQTGSSVPDSLKYVVATGKITNNELDRFNVEIDMPAEGYLFISQNWYPEWIATENGQNLEILRADYAFTAVFLNAGKHTVHFEYEGRTVKKSVRFSIASFSVLVILLFVTGLMGKKNDRQN